VAEVEAGSHVIGWRRIAATLGASRASAARRAGHRLVGPSEASEGQEREDALDPRLGVTAPTQRVPERPTPPGFDASTAVITERERLH
jgi:hypothetical protein